MQKLKFLTIPLAFILMTCLFSCADENDSQIVEEAAIENIDPQGSEEVVGAGVDTRSFNYKRYTFSTLSAALHCTGLTNAVFSGENTIYAPSDEAFEKLGLNAHNICSKIDRETLTSILTYHVASGLIDFRDAGCITTVSADVAIQTSSDHRFFINQSNIYLKWRQSRHGRFNVQVYAIDMVLTKPQNNIVETAQGAPSFSTLVQAVLAAEPGVLEALSDDGAIFTVFAPTNQAFQNLLVSLGVNDLNQLVNVVGSQGLSNILFYHVVGGCAASPDLVDGQQLTTIQGGTIRVDLPNLRLIDGTNMASNLVPSGLDILTDNGIIHTIDRVLMP